MATASFWGIDQSAGKLMLPYIGWLVRPSQHGLSRLGRGP